MQTVQVGQQGEITLPPEIGRNLLAQGVSQVRVEQRGKVIVVRPLQDEDLIEEYTPQRQAEFLLNCAIDSEDYEGARQTVRAMGIDPDSIEHDRPVGV